MTELQEYLTTKGIEFQTRGNEVITRCLFSGCDEGRMKLSESHLYLNKNTGQYQCKKCNENGNLITLRRHFNDIGEQYGHKQSLGRIHVRSQKEFALSLSQEAVEQWHTALPVEIIEWLQNDRGIHELVIKQAKLGWDKNHLIIPVADEKGKWLFVKKRVSPLKDGDGPKYVYTKGAKAKLYGIQLLAGEQTVVICEGELDALLLRSKGFIAVSTTGGAGTFEESWSTLFKDIPNVHVLYDNDKAGRDGALKVAKLIPHAKISFLPEEVGEHGDVTDYLMKLKKTVDDLYSLLKQGKNFRELEEQGDRYISLPEPEQNISIEHWRKSLHEHFPECLMAAEVGVSTIVQLLIKDVRNPFALVYVDVPSSGKTITLNFFSSLEEIVYTTDAFTPASLVSHASNRKVEDLEKIDLLPRIRHRMLIVRDLAPLFAERQDALLKNLGVLTRVFDGEGYESDSGVHGKRGYRGDYTFMFLAGSTPILPRVWKFMGNLGSRLFFLNLRVNDKSEDELADLLAAEDFKKKENFCRDLTRNLILAIWKDNKGGIVWNKKQDPKELRSVISKCAQLLANLRGSVNVWSDNEEGHEHTNTVIEKPMRINQLLYNLARGHALSCGRQNLTNEDMWPVIETTLSSAQYNRIKALEVLLENDGLADTALVETSIGCSNPTALKEMETLKILGIADLENRYSPGQIGRPEKIMRIKECFSWFYSDECKKMRSMRPGLN